MFRFLSALFGFFTLFVSRWMVHHIEGATPGDRRRSAQPHVLFILVDDLGWGDVGFNRPESPEHVPKEIQTANMDRLSQGEGIVLHRHYVHSSCTGTRVSLQSGRLPVHVQTSLKYPEDPSSGMPRNMTGFAEHLLRAGYRTHYVGKWDVGMATPKHTPFGRGYETSLHYFEHKNDYWTQACMQSKCCPNYHGDDETKQIQLGDPERTSSTPYLNLSLTDLWDTMQPAKHLNGSDYEEFILLDRMKKVIREHDAATEPLLLFYAPHVAHCPLQVPQEYLDRFDDGIIPPESDEPQCRAQTPNIVPMNETQPKFSCRKQYHAMVTLLDDLIGEIVDELKTADLWKDTLLVFTSDNGGPTKLEESGSTNYDLRGGKYSDWEGGVRAAAFVSGGFLPEARRGTTIYEPIHIADWYVTLTTLAGVTAEIENAQEDGRFPPMDSVNIWPLIINETYGPSPRQEIALSHNSLIQGDYKLIWSDTVDQSGWTGPIYPNASSHTSGIFQNLNCSNGCLFNVAEDRGEHLDLASQQPLRLKAMKARLVELRKGFFENDDRGDDSCPSDIDMPCACWMAINYYGGFLGPYQEIDLHKREEIPTPTAVTE